MRDSFSMVASVRTEGYGGSRHPFTMADFRLDKNHLKVKERLQSLCFNHGYKSTLSYMLIACDPINKN